MDSDFSSRSLQDLLAFQLNATSQLLALNQAITARLGSTGQLGPINNHISPRQTPRVSNSAGEDSLATHAAYGKWLLRQHLQPAQLQDATYIDVGDTNSTQFLKTPAKSTFQAPDGQKASSKTHSPSDPKVALLAMGSNLAEPLLQKMLHPGNVMSSPGSPHPEMPSRRRGGGIAHTAAVKKAPPPKKQEYNVEDLYHTTGCAQKVARNQAFQSSTLVVILCNTIWMAIDTDYNKADVLCLAPPLFQVVDNLFCFYFVFEISIRLLSFRHTMDALGDFWFLGDTSLVLLMVWETWIQVALFVFTDGGDTGGGGRSASVLRIFRAFRLLRISRMSRLLRSMPELFILVKSIGAAMRCMFVTLCMLMIVIYVFSIMFTQLLSDTETGKARFETVPMSINFMLTQVLCGFDSAVFTVLLDTGVVYYILWLIYVLIGSLSIMNVLIGILCEVVSGTAEDEKERAVRNDVEHQIVLTGIDEDRQYIGKQEMMLTLESTQVAEKITELGVDVHSLLDFVHFFEAGVEMALCDFVELVVQFRGTKNTTVRDIVDLRKFISMEIGIIEARLTKQDVQLATKH